MIKVFIGIALMLCPWLVLAQTDSIKTTAPGTIFKVDGEWRPRLEYRNGYRSLPDSFTHPALFVSNRTRLNIFLQKEKFSTYFSIQDVRIWGDQDFRSVSMISTFQAWAELILTKHISAKIGRQTLIYDNERLFAQNNWRQSGGSHDALLFKFRRLKTEADLGVSFNQTGENIYGTDYAALQTRGNYKLLIIQWFSHQFSENFKVKILNASDGFQSLNNPEQLYLRVTNGGRVEYETDKWYFTLSGYYQWGKNPDRQLISAYYIQPEIKYSGIRKMVLRLGCEYLSGTDATDTDNRKFNSFVPLYGVAHRFMGYMDYFIRFPEDVKGAGLVNPYLMTSYKLGKKITLKTDFHTFYSQNNYVHNGAVIDKYLGFENDMLCVYKPSKEIMAEIGYSWMLTGKSLEIIKGGERKYKEFPHWLYIMITIKPELFELRK